MKPMSLLFIFMFLLSGTSVWGQSFGGVETQSNNSAEAFGLLLEESKSGNKQQPSSESPQELKTTDDVAKALEDEKARILQERETIFMPNGGVEKLRMPTEDNSVRGNLTIVETDDKGQSRVNSKIFLFMDKFGISRSIGNMITCDMRFIILTNLDRRLISLDTKLVWPGMTTTLSFANVAPNTPTAYNYTLMGDGCYTMDKMPNIIVNRCRVKGLSSAQCADKIVWLSDAK